MLVALNAEWKIPVGYFLTNGLSGEEKANLIKILLTSIHNTGVTVTSVTFDGAPGNISAMEKLGACFKIGKLRTYFKHPVTNENIYIFLDACHMLKLIRNCFAIKKH